MNIRTKISSLIIRNTPISVKEYLRKHGFKEFANNFINKSEGELMYQVQFYEFFKKDKKEVLREWWEKYRELKRINKLCKFSTKTKTLDVGCGIISVLHFIKGKKFAIDPLAEEYKRIYNYPKNIKLIKADGENIPFRDKYFDVVFCTNVLDHTNDASLVISEIARVLKDKGLFVLSIYIFNKKFERDPAHTYVFSKKDIISLIRKNFKIVFIKEQKNMIKPYEWGEPNPNTELFLLLKKI